jgi:hypothetical protein
MDKVVHFEIPFDNKERALKFYRESFGWDLVDLPGMNYVMAHAAKTDKKNMVQDKGAINGGLFPREKEAKSSIVVIGVQDMDAAIKRVIAAGGRQIMPKQAIPNGFYARVSDCEGNIIGLASTK